MDSDQSAENAQSDRMSRAFSELSSYHSGTSVVSSNLSSGETGDSDASSASDEVTSSDLEGFTTDSDFETEETSETSTRSPHSSDTSYGLTALIEETDRQKLAEFVHLRPEDRRWIDAAWTYFDKEPVYRRQAKPVKVVRKMRTKIMGKVNWTELQHEYNLRHPLCAAQKATEDLQRLSIEARYMPLPDLNV
ncbi:unnamed protein product [Cylicocyclus nassatus]|uniref:Uncharacterized protein n=1 Tax=Cylicocyclus nassatus TaxID=53992 RepID=A0AA36GYH2_CYLNA|nr:unnamed protein product [Cylicocyclus nassatus]